MSQTCTRTSSILSFETIFNAISFFYTCGKKQTAVRSGDYYLFADLDEKIELDLINERASAGIEDSMAEKKLADKMTIEQVSARISCIYRLARGIVAHVTQRGHPLPIPVHKYK